MARRFQFRLEVVRRLREKAEMIQRRAVAQAAGELTAVQGRMAELSQRIGATEDNARTVQQTFRLDVGMLREHQFHLGWLHRERADAERQRIQCQGVLNERRLDLAEAAKKRKVIEKLRERRWSQHRELVRREEQASADEIAGVAYLRRKGAAGAGTSS